jgi:cytochrome c peroxidase
VNRLALATGLLVASFAMLAAARLQQLAARQSLLASPVVNSSSIDRAAFARPKGLPPTLAPSQTAVDLGRQLFHDPRLSSDGTMSCATCHQPQLGFTDGHVRHPGRNGLPLRRHTPHLWNLAWSETLYWDGRAKTLEQQAQEPLEHPQEMAGNLARVTDDLRADPRMTAAFAAAFPEQSTLDGPLVLKALAAFERSLISPDTKFDRWIAGDAAALDTDEQAGFKLFTGKAECAACHSGWRFTDEAFHDIGLPDTGDRGRGAILKLAAANHGFKTPSLRELAWTAPYMHDGSLPTLEAVIAHYAGHVAQRPTLSKDMPPVLALTDAERQQLLAFLITLSSENPPQPPQTAPKIEVALSNISQQPSIPTSSVGQKDKRFTPSRVTVSVGQSLTIVNDDRRTHNVRIDDPRMSFTSNAQEPGDSVIIAFPNPGEFGVICSIHPTMHLDVTVNR